MNHHYVDAQAFSELFGDRAANHAQICLTLDRMAQGIADALRWRDPHDRDDARSAALVRAIEQIGRYRPDRGNAFSFFTTVMRRHMLTALRDDSARRRGGKSIDGGSY